MHRFIRVQNLKTASAVAQKSPCEEIRVIMSKEFPLKLSQRGLDAREEVPMRTPKRLYAAERIIYQPELLTCPHCGDLLVLWNYLAWDKTVQTLDRVLSLAARPSHCPQTTCPSSRHSSPSPPPMCAISTSPSTYPSWAATSGSSEADWPRLPRHRAG